MVFEDGAVWKIQTTRFPRYSRWRRCMHGSGVINYGPDKYFNRPQELEKIKFLWSGTLDGTNETVWWGHDPQKHRYYSGASICPYFGGYVHNSKTKDTLRFVTLIRDYGYNCSHGTTDVGGVLYDKELNYRSQCVKHSLDHKCFGRKTARRWWLSPSKEIGGFICRKVGSSSSKDFYLVGTKEADYRFESKDFPCSQKCDETKKRKQKKQMLMLKRRKKDKRVSNARRRARDQKYLLR